MMKTSGFGRWGPAAGVLAVGLLAFSLSLEGAAPSPQPPATMKDKAAPPETPSLIEENQVRPEAEGKTAPVVRSGHATEATGTTSAVQPLPEGIKYGRVPNDIPIMEPMTVDYRDDVGTRMRQAGQLVGPYRPNAGAVAAGGCSFDIQCDDCNPCTNDVCNIQPGDALGSGTCINAALGNGAEGGCSDGLCCNGRETCQGGVCQNPGAGTGVFDPNACQFPCSGGTVCNEDNNLCRLPCDGTNFCAITGGPCTSTPDCPPQTGNYCKNCNDGVNCNGVESCVAGVCESGTNPCGSGATCGEKACATGVGTICTTDSDCGQAGPCSRPGPICFPGRCCNNSTAEPSCTKRQGVAGTCSGGSNATGICLSNAQCPGGGTCSFTQSCAVFGGGVGKWYPSDDGGLPIPGGTTCPTDPQTNPPNDRTLCPKYSSGIAPPVNFDTENAFIVGLFSQGPCDHQEIGDDYHIENASPIAMEKFRWVGGGGGRLLIEFYDASGNFIEDAITGGIGGGNAVQVLNFLPPLTIPANGFWVVSVATNFAPNGQTFVTATDAVDEGTNLASGANSLWFDGGPTSMSLRECVGGTNDGAWCDPDDLGDSECVGGGGACVVRNNVLAFEIEGLKVSAPSGACCNNGTGTCTPGVLPWVCTGQGNNYQGNDSTCPGTCGVGACCAPAGTCSITTGAACTGANTFQGFGTDCSPNCCEQPFSGGDNCEDVITVHNIPVPDPGDPPVVVTISGDNSVATGPDSCLQGAWNAAGGTYLTVDPGWWEAFTIDSCAFVRVDFCCSDPVVEPQWALIWEGCPCDDAVFTSVDPNVPGEPANKRGSPYCEDDNLWNKFGPLPGGTCVGGSAAGKGCVANSQCPGSTCAAGHTYYVPVYSVPPGANAAYQMHITVEACPLAACCNGTSCTETDQLGCAAIDGANFLAPPFRTSATTTCTASTCNTGSCCYVPGQSTCVDVIAGVLANPTNCNNANGEYKGGVRCFGCVCASGNASCNDNDDCGLNGPCNNPGGGVCSGQNLTAPSPCPVCDFDSTLRCQRQPGYDGARLSDLCTGDCISDPPLTEYSLPGIRTADDFVASVGGSITSVCVWGIYGAQDGSGNLPDCSASGPPEQFTVRIYNDNGGLPGSLVGVRSTTVTRKGETFLSGTRHIFQWQLALSSGLPVTAGNTYWLEVVNNTDESQGDPVCDWFWALSDPDAGADSGNQYFLQDAGSTYTFGDAVFDGADMAWCINLDNTVPPIKQAACCTCGGGVGSCSVQKLEDCVNADGSWQSNEPDCIGVVCRNDADAADTCVTEKVAVSTGSDTAWNNFCANTDGPATAGNSGCTAGLDAQADLWYTWTADCDGNVVIETCDTGGEIDTMLLVYTNNNGTCPCPTSAANETACDDDGCVFVGSGSRITMTAVDGVCYTIRVAGFQGVKGQGVLHVGTCEGGGGNPVDLNGDTSPNPIKTRFVSFNAVGGTGETAIRIILSSMHVVVPPYSGGATIPFTAFNGRVVWAGPPQNFVESSSNPIPTKISFASCTPHYRNWNTEGLVHVTGPQIVPSSTFLLENVAAACAGVEGTAACLTGGANVSVSQLEVKTTRWADVTDPYNPPSATVQPDVADIGALVNKFRSAPGAPIKARAEIAGAPANPWGEITPAVLSVDLGFSHISACVDGFRGAPYPYKMGKCAGAPTPPATGACTTNSECTGTNGAGPCNLYCPN